MKKALMIAPAASVFQKFCKVNIECLKKAGYEIYLASNYSDSDEKKQKQYDEFEKWCNSEGIKTHDIKFSRKSLFKNIKIIKELKRYIRENNFDLVHCHTETGGMISVLALNKNCSAKKIYTPHGISFYKGGSRLNWMLFYPLEKWICGKMDKVIAINNEEFEIISGWKNNDTKLVHGIGIDTGKICNVTRDKYGIRKEFGINGDEFFVLCIGELNENKNHKAVINAISKIKDKKVKCVICGVGKLKEELKNISAELGLQEQVILAGYRTDIPDILSSADVLAFPSYHEGLPVSVMEAMVAGLPVVCSEIRGNVDLIQNGVGGFLINPENPDEIKNALEELMKDVSLREKMGQINKENVKKFDLSSVEIELLNVYV